MNERDEQTVRLVRNAIGPMEDAELARDLWPRMLDKMQGTAIRVPWFDWALAGLLVLLLCLCPAAIPGILYHL